MHTQVEIWALSILSLQILLHLYASEESQDTT